jgi:hypothetical protein
MISLTSGCRWLLAPRGFPSRWTKNLGGFLVRIHPENSQRREAAKSSAELYGLATAKNDS